MFHCEIEKIVLVFKVKMIFGNCKWCSPWNKLEVFEKRETKYSKILWPIMLK